jgi:glutamine synthetase
MKEQKPWFGLEQEYFIFFHERLYEQFVNDGLHYCCGSSDNKLERILVEQHLNMCLSAGLKISGMNSEVSYSQWEFQIGPCEGIEAGDHLITARYLLEKIANSYNARIEYHPKPILNINGSGCHINFSTEDTRSKDGICKIYEYIEKLQCKHRDLISVYGEHNECRLTGIHETSSIHKFSWGIGTRNTSIRIPNQTYQNSCGYFEDRRPASNIDPYLATSSLFRICCFND